MKEQEGIFTRVGKEYFIFKRGREGCFAYDTPSWGALNRGANLWRWDEDDIKRLGTLKVPMEYLT